MWKTEKISFLMKFFLFCASKVIQLQNRVFIMRRLSSSGRNNKQQSTVFQHTKCTLNEFCKRIQAAITCIHRIIARVHIRVPCICIYIKSVKASRYWFRVEYKRKTVWKFYENWQNAARARWKKRKKRQIHQCMHFAKFFICV